ncbi:glycosyltransferase family 4 protein [Pseudonocardia yuanmonensis]|uniref:Glycosyltransferase family 4 protein n=1 Tax=Pseudonocardia yuanmonensis TaxID=1095914 RepID=A0ABP8VXR2_9PSEU
MVSTRRRHVCIVVQNLPVPFDRRVWNECAALRAAGFDVSVVCPKGEKDPSHQVLDGVHLFKYAPFPPITRQALFVAEYLYSIMATVLLLCRAWRHRRFDVVQVCNPPDVLFLAVLPFKALFGVKMVFDHHDLCPELYKSRFTEKPGLAYRALVLAERLTFAVADHVVSTNESYRKVALERGRKDPTSVTVVRTGPDPRRLRRIEPEPSLRRGHPYLLAYLGVMGPQDGVDLAIRAMDHIVRERGRKDVALTLIGDGDMGPELRRLVTELHLEGVVEFTGRVPDSLVARILSSADIGLSPDPKNLLNDVSTMNKTMEYMAFELPVVAFDLVETRVSAGDAAAYAEPNRVEKFGDVILELLDDELRRKSMAAAGRRRVEERLAWSHQAAAYVSVYDRLTSG